MEETTGSTPTRKISLAVPILFGVVLALIAANAVVFVQLDGMRQEMAAMRQALASEIGKVRDSAQLSDSTSRQTLEKLRQELAQAQQQASAAAGKARQDALKHAEELARRIQEEQARQQAQVAGELNQVREAATSANSKISDVASEVGSVRTEVASTRSELEKTISELKSVRGDLGVQSGLIATNARELAALRALGDRDYFEFRITKSKQFSKVGNVQIQLTKVDVKKNKYTIQVIADDKRVEKKDKGINEPVQFYVTGSRQPLEIVVNEIGKDQISGYLAAPKTLRARG